MPLDFPTRNENTLDLIFTSHPSYKERCKPISAIGNSDHHIVLLECNPIKPKQTRHKISLWKKVNIYKIQEDLIVFGENFRDQTFDSIERMWNHFKTAVKRIIDQRVPTNNDKSTTYAQS
jgi:hypothetical protein